MKRTASGAHWISSRRERHARPPSAQAEHQWSGEGGRRVFEERKIETRSDDLEIALREGVAISERGRSNRDRATRSVLAMPGREQSDGALMTRVRAGLVNALVQLGRGRENQREKKSAEEPRGRKRVPGIRFASDETQPHWARLCFVPRSWASTISAGSSK